MNRAIFTTAVISSLLITHLTSGEPERRFPFEESALEPTDCLSATNMKRLAAGLPPYVSNLYAFGGAPGRSPFGYKDSDGIFRRANMQVGFVTNYETNFSIADLVKVFDSEGMVVIRDKNGTIIKAGTLGDWFFVRKEKDVIVLERYLTKDCAVDKNGEVNPLPGAIADVYQELRQISFDSKNKVRHFRIVEYWPTINTQPYRYLESIFIEQTGRSKAIMREYLGHELDAKFLTYESSLERAIWPEGKGFQQISRKEVNREGKMILTRHTVEYWRVEKNGERVKIKEEDLREKHREPVSDENLR